MESGTFAIVGRSSDGRRLGVAVAAALPAAGAFCLAARAGVGAVSVQGQVQPALRARLLDLMAEGVAAEEALARVWQADAGRDRRRGRGLRGQRDGLGLRRGRQPPRPCRRARRHGGRL